MSVIAEKCPSCGAPLSVVAGRCSYCQTPLEVVRPDGTEAVPPDDVEQVPEDPNAPFSMAVEDIFSIKGRGTVITGRIAAGTVRVGDKLVLDGPKGQRRADCKGVEMFRKVLDSATAGDNVGLLLKGLDRDDIERGDQVRHA